MKRIVGLVVVGVFAGSLALAADAGEKKHTHKAGEAVDVTGEIVDIMCYSAMGREGGSGPKHKACATSCINGGGPVGILTDEDQLILVVGAEHGDIKKIVADFIAGQVKVTGTMSDRGGLRMLAVTKIVADTSAPRKMKKAAASTEAKDAWICPMGCSKSDKPGKCSGCGMDMVKQKS